MSSSETVQNTHKSEMLRDFHLSLLEIVSVLNEPQRDETIIAAAGLKLDRALFPLLIGIERFGPIGIVQLAAGVNRDHTTVSRQVAKLEALGLVAREQDAGDRRTRRAVVTPQGQAMTERIDAVRERVLREVFRDWPPEEVSELARLTAKFAAGFRQATDPGASASHPP